MKKTFQMVGILVLLLGSFIYTDEVKLVSINSDSLLNEIKEKSSNYKIAPKEPVIYEDTIIPGVNGKKIDINASYKKMRKVGYFDEKLLVYKTINLEHKLNDNLDKYIISGNTDKKEIALIFKTENNVDKIIDVLDKNKIKGGFFITSKYMEKNNETVLTLINNGHTIGILNDFNTSNFIWMKSIISNYQNNYCYTENKNIEIINICKNQNSRTIIPTKIISNYPLINVKNNLKSGAIISFKVNSILNKELENIINYIQSKGYKIVSLEKLLSQ